MNNEKMKETEEKKPRERRFVVILSGDANDADYITETRFISLRELPPLQIWARVMDEYDNELQREGEDDGDEDYGNYCDEFRAWVKKRLEEQNYGNWTKEQLEGIFETMNNYLPRDPGYGEWPYTLEEFCVFELASEDPIDLLSDLIDPELALIL